MQSKINFAVQIFNIGTPLEHGITFNDVVAFYQLYNNPSSNFRVWCDTNNDEIERIVKDEGPILYKTIDKYMSDNIQVMVRKSKIIIERLKYIREQPSNTLIGDIREEIPVGLTGGDFTDKVDINDDFMIKFCLMIMFYLFSRNKIDTGFLPMAKRVENTGVLFGSGDTDDENIVSFAKDISGDAKAKERIVLIVGVNGAHEVVIKISRPIKYYTTEVEIYKELARAQNTDIKIDNFVVRTFGSEIQTVDEDILFTLDGVDYVIPMNEFGDKIMDRINNLDPFQNEILGVSFEDTDTIIYNVLEYTPTFCTLDACSNMIKNAQKCTMIEKIINKLDYMHKRYGFSHLDLHGGNILINIESDTFKFFDFDLSQTTINQNNELFERISPILSRQSGKENLFFLYDVTRLINGFYTDSFTKTGCTRELENIIVFCVNIFYKAHDNSKTGTYSFFDEMQKMILLYQKNYKLYEIIEDYIFKNRTYIYTVSNLDGFNRTAEKLGMSVRELLTHILKERKTDLFSFSIRSSTDNLVIETDSKITDVAINIPQLLSKITPSSNPAEEVKKKTTREVKKNPTTDVRKKTTLDVKKKSTSDTKKKPTHAIKKNTTTISTKTKKGGYESKYLKYKQKYLTLKSK